MKPGRKQFRAVGKALKPTFLYHILPPSGRWSHPCCSICGPARSLVAEWKKEGVGWTLFCRTLDVVFGIVLVSHWPELGHIVP